MGNFKEGSWKAEQQQVGNWAEGPQEHSGWDVAAGSCCAKLPGVVDTVSTVSATLHHPHRVQNPRGEQFCLIPGHIQHPNGRKREEFKLLSSPTLFLFQARSL